MLGQTKQNKGEWWWPYIVTGDFKIYTEFMMEVSQSHYRKLIAFKKMKVILEVGIDSIIEGLQNLVLQRA